MEEVSMEAYWRYLYITLDPWSSFFAMATVGAVVMLLGMMMEKASVFLIPFFAAYVLWMLFAAMFLKFTVQRSSEFALRCVPYLVMTGVTIFVIASSLKVSSDQLYVYLPTCINVGIVLGNGIDHAWSIVVKGIKRAWTGACRSIVQLLNTLAEQEDEFEDRWNREGRLPVFEDRTRGFAEQQRRVSIEVEDASPEDEPPSRSTQQAPLALPSGFSITADDSNPW